MPAITELTARQRVGSLLYYAIVILLGYLLYLIFAPFLVPLAWAAVIVVVTYPAYEWAARRWNPTIAALLTTIAVTAILIVPIVFLMIAFVKQGMSAVQTLNTKISTGTSMTWLDHMWTRIQAHLPQMNLGSFDESIHSYIDQGVSSLAARIGTILKHTAGFFFDAGLTILAMFYLYRDGDSMMGRVREILPFQPAHRDRMLLSVHELIYASVISSLAAGVVHAFLGGVAFEVAGVNSPIFWGVLMGLCSFIPVIGSVLVWGPLAIGLMFAGHWKSGIFLVIACAVIIGMVDNFIRPWLISGRSKMGGLVILIAVLGGISVFGMLGVVLGPIVVAIVAGVLDLYAPSAESENTEVKLHAKRAKAVLE
jgi:predicted PurR-regulated permease PerM